LYGETSAGRTARAEVFASYTDAFAAERQINGWSRAKKQALIDSDWDAIHRLARNGRARRKNLGE
tara:strand:+ start:2027 stop:2221 length:195 start_codon:yes stop_codon:yes gene_type:complete